MTTTEPKLGSHKVEPDDPRDIPLKALLSEGRSVLIRGPIVDWRAYCSPVEDQRYLSSCVGNAVVGGLEMLEKIRNGTHLDLSRLFTYYNARAAINETERDDGSYIRDAMNSLAVIGVCPETDWPYDPTKVLIRPPWRAYRTAYGHKISKFYKIFSTGEERIAEIESALRVGAPVAFGCEVDTPFINHVGRGPVPMIGSNRRGSHAMLIVGFDSSRRVFFVRNSWGKTWGDNGYCEMPYDYLTASHATDFWAMTL